jgi:hypothetical protein
VARLGLDATAVRALRLFVWPLHTRSEYARYTADAGGRPSTEALGRSQLVPFWEEEVRALR